LKQLHQKFHSIFVFLQSRFCLLSMSWLMIWPKVDNWVCFSDDFLIKYELEKLKLQFRTLKIWLKLLNSEAKKSVYLCTLCVWKSASIIIVDKVHNFFFFLYWLILTFFSFEWKCRWCKEAWEMQVKVENLQA
jgi:hypothetical protein